MVTWRKSSSWMSSPVAASTSRLAYITITSFPAHISPADSSVWSSSTNKAPPAKTFTQQSLRSVGSSRCFLATSIAFKSWRVSVGKTSKVSRSPSKVATCSSPGPWSKCLAIISRRYFVHLSSVGSSIPPSQHGNRRRQQTRCRFLPTPLQHPS